MGDSLVTVLGLPLHPLIIHLVVVLLPLAALCAVAIAVYPRWRRKYGSPVLVLTVVAVATVPVATTTGEQLAAARYGTELPEAVAHHHSLADWVLPTATAFGVALLLFTVLGRFLDRRAAQAPPDTTPAPAWRVLQVVLGALVVLSAACAATAVVLTGDAGASSVWGGVTG